MASSYITPMSMHMHYDDIEQVFALHASEQQKTPEGTFNDKLKELLLPTLTALFEAALRYWLYGGGDAPTYHANFPIGNWAEFQAFVAAVALPDLDIQVPPSPTVDDSGVDDPSYAWAGSVDFPLP